MAEVTIDRKITGVGPVGKHKSSAAAEQRPVKLLSRPEVCTGSTYKLKLPDSEHALYVTINNTEHNGKVRPFEVFINSKNMEHYQWVIALTRVVSAVFRQTDDASFLVQELKSVFDPRGGFWKQGGEYVPSLVAEIGNCLERHMVAIGAMDKPEAKTHGQTGCTIGDKKPVGNQCPSCGSMSLVKQEGCDNCMACGYSKCQ
jgi:ribonucleoside-diphosphate reductase alpha chain